MDILKKHMPKEILAAVLELTGWIPETGESYCATKEGNQVDINRKEISVDAEEEIAVGPFYRENDILYENNVMRWHVCARTDERKNSLLKELSKINLMEEDGAYGMDHR